MRTTQSELSFRRGALQLRSIARGENDYLGPSQSQKGASVMTNGFHNKKHLAATTVTKKEKPLTRPAVVCRKKTSTNGILDPTMTTKAVLAGKSQ